ncbi:transposase [Pukyongiella litopenaei]|uniref:Transposase n=1 Tax=Pukyongiella litopenaei TaxID=2605946 RepID=A0A2S0MQH0_9RHOB|nr:transposase [Pukyongiella litopenaei]
MSQREAARHFGISRDSVRMVLAISIPPDYQRSAPIRRPKLVGFTGNIDQWLSEDREQPRKQRHTAKRIFERLRGELGLAGGYTIIKDYLREHGRHEHVQVLRLFESYEMEEVHAAIRAALQMGTISFDAVKHRVLCRIERRPPRLDLDVYPYLPMAKVATTSPASYLCLTAGASI